jgi:uncharacterized protein (TIGR02270 family)
VNFSMREYSRPEPLIDILEEHIDEAAFLYNCRLRILVDPERSWEDLHDYEKRLFPHLHGLALARFSSAKLLKEKLVLDEDGDPGQTFVAAAVYPMLELVEPMQWLIEAITQKPPHVRAIIDGLKFSMGPNLDGWLEYFLEHAHPEVRAVGAEVIGYRGLTRFAQKLVILQRDPEPCVAMAANYSLANLKYNSNRELLVPFMKHPDLSLISRSLELLLRMGDQEAIAFCRETLDSAPDPDSIFVYFTAISGADSDTQLIHKVMQRQPALTESCLLALALYGNIDSVDVLISHLGNIDIPDVFMAAYQGLRSLTGMDYLPTFDFDEVQAEEVLKFQSQWSTWWSENRNRFPREFKWRRGEKISPVVLQKDLLRAGNSCRDLTYLEMVIRYGCPINFQHNQFYGVQTMQLQELGQWAELENDRFKPGLAYFHGRRLN